MLASEPESNVKDWTLSAEENLTFHQLAAKKYWAEKSQRNTDPTDNTPSQEEDINQAPGRWVLLGDLKLFTWQKDCVENWFAAGGKGTVKVVTGAGKTILALRIMEQLQNEVQPDLRVAIVVPTIVLMDQWYEEITSRSNLPETAIGRLGGGHDDDFGEECRILICVLNSAQAKLPELVQGEGHGKRLLLVIDECHRAGSTVMRRVFRTRRKYNLGLSATPERDDPALNEEEETEANSTEVEEHSYENSLLGQELGPIVYHMTLRDAFRMGVLPSYEIRHYGLPLAVVERQRYEQLSRQIQDSRDQLSGIASAKGVGQGAAFHQWCRMIARQEGDIAGLASQYIANTTKRKALLYHAEARQAAVLKLLHYEFEENPKARAILFHESIDEAMTLWQVLVENGFPAVPENSELPASIREGSLDLFRRGIGQILVSVRSLVEGFNVPATDIGIIVASSTSVRQRIQTIGRVLRKHRGKSGEEKNAIIHVLYIRDTVDEVIYEKFRWEEMTGAERNLYYLWDPVKDSAPVPQEQPPRRPLPADTEIDPTQLSPGDIYPGVYEGQEYSSDTQGNIYVTGEEKLYASNPQGIPELIRQTKGSYGRFRVTPNRQYVLVIVPDKNDWQTIYVTTLQEPFQFREASETQSTNTKRVRVNKLKPGDEFTGRVLKDAQTYGKRQKRGRIVITRAVNRGELWALTSEQAVDPERGKAAELLIQALADVERELGIRIPEFRLTDEGHATFLHKGKWIYIGSVENDLEFPET